MPFESSENKPLGGWVHRQRKMYAKGELEKERQKKLEKLEFRFVWG